MEASATIAVEPAAGTGPARARFARLRSDPPLALRATGGDVVHLVGSAAGPIGGDRLALDIAVGAGASLTVRTVAAAVALPGPAGAPSSLTVTADVGPGASLRWLAEPTIAVQGSDHRAIATVRLAQGARLVWRELVVLGRHREPPGSLLQSLRVELEGRPLAHHDLALGPAWPASLGPGGIDGARTVGAALVVGGCDAGSLALDPPPGARAAVLELGSGHGALLVVVAPGTLGPVAALDQALRGALGGM